MAFLGLVFILILIPILGHTRLRILRPARCRLCDHIQPICLADWSKWARSIQAFDIPEDSSMASYRWRGRGGGFEMFGGVTSNFDSWTGLLVVFVVNLFILQVQDRDELRI